mmetsp:Transcript_11303/g.22701  ORF Transcript_11303/g.22701 Transcript_11303/m.22701 type:complete len:140 (-) Transcript_11303:2283-2702(-)
MGFCCCRRGAPSPPKRYRFDWNNADWESFSAHIDAATNWSTAGSGGFGGGLQQRRHGRSTEEKELADKDMREALPGRLRRAAKFRLLRINRKVRKNEQLLRTNSWRNFCNSFEDASQLYALFKRSKGKWLKASTCRVQL